MRDPKRIKRILILIEKIWRKQPDLRLTQLLANCVDAVNYYNFEDKILEERLRDFYKEPLTFKDIIKQTREENINE